MLTSYLYYQIFFQDQAEYNAAVALAGGTGYGHCPENAASTFGIPWPPPSGDMALIPRGITFPTVQTLLGWLESPVDINTKTAVDSFILTGIAGNPATIWPKGPDCNFVWWGTFIYMPAEVAGVPATTPIPQRRWICGFEHAGTSSEGSSTALFNTGRSSSRVTGGRGFRVKGNSGTSYAQTRVISTLIAGLAPKTSWERFYVRINALGTNDLILWYAKNNNPTVEGCSIRITTAGVPLLYNNTGGPTVGTLEATSPTTLTVGKWYLFDILLTWPVGAGDSGGARLYINHVLDCQFTVNGGVGMDRVTYHEASILGQQSTRETSWEFDLDDWICSDVPNNGGVESLDSIDWFCGSHVRTVNIVSGDVGIYTGADYTALNQYPNPNLMDGSRLGTITALEQMIDLLSDQTDTPEGLGIQLGPIAMVLEAYASNGIALTGRIAYSILGGALVWSNISVLTTYSWIPGGYLPTGAALPATIAPVSFAIEKPNNANQFYVNALSAIIEYLGVWGLEDEPTLAFDLSNNVWQHNGRYANTAWALFPYIGPQASPVYAIGGTYAGNDLSHTIDVSAPPHFIWIREVAASTATIHWFASAEGGHEGGDIDVYANYITRVWADANGYHITVSGNSAKINAVGSVYQYIVFCDPGMRFNYCDNYDYAEVRASVTKDIFDPNWLADAGFIQPEILQAAGGVVELTYKGPGHAGTTGVNVSGIEKADFGSFGVGDYTIGADNLADNRTSQFSSSLWRMLDNDGLAMLQITSYVGDGNVFRVISLPLVTGRYPLFAMVIPNNGVDAYFRDPSHTANNSQLMTSGVNSTSAIIGGGIDELYIGVTLNTLGVTYEVFIILGDSAGWNNGSFTPDYGLSTGPWTPPPYIPPDKPIIIGDGGLLFNGQMSSLIAVNMSGIYTLVKNKRNDTFYTGVGKATTDVKIAKPEFKTGYIGG